MRKRGWVVAGIAGAAAIVMSSTMGFDRQPPALPACPKILTAPVGDAVRTAFTLLWDQRRTQFSDTPGSSTCDFSASSVLDDAEPGTPRSRALGLHLVQETPSMFQDRRVECRPSSAATGFADERGLGDESFGCWVTYEVKPFSYVDRRLYFRIGGISVLLSLSGADYGPQSAVDHTARLRADLARNTRCVAEALANRFGAPVTQQRTCPGTASNM